MPNGTDESKRIDRSKQDPVTGAPYFNEGQRIWLLERDFDKRDIDDEEWKRQVKEELGEIRRLVSSRLNWIVGLGFSLLIAVVAVLVTVVASK